MTQADTRPGPEQTYQQYLATGTFMIQRCGSCHEHFFYPRVLCPTCGSMDHDWVRPTGKGTVYSTTVMRRKPDAGGDYNVSIIELSEGPRLTSRVDNVAPGDVRIGMSVVARVAMKEGAPPLVLFDAAGDHDAAN